MELVSYCAAWLLAKILRLLPLRFLARLGRCGGAVAYYLDARHRRVALLNLTRCFPDNSRGALLELCREHFRRLGENYACAVKTTGMSDEELAKHLTITGTEHLLGHGRGGAVVAIGHFGNFEVHARIRPAFPGMTLATTYRPLKQPKLDVLVRRLRGESGCLFFDRRREGEALRRTLAGGGVVLGLLSDQHAGSGGLRVPFFGHPCSTNPAPALLAQRYDLPLHTAVCYRVALAKWRIQFGPEIPTRVGDVRRSPADIMTDVNAEFEKAVRRDPPNWFWVHDRWRFMKESRALGDTVVRGIATA